MKTLVLGLGNELYGDDGIGIHIIQKLEADPEFKSADLHACGLTGLSILDVIIGYDHLIIIDTIKKNDPAPGKIHVMDESKIRHIPGPSPHYVSIPQTIEIGKKIGLKVPKKIKVIAVEANNLFYLGEGLSSEMKACIPAIQQKVKSLLVEIKK